MMNHRIYHHHHAMMILLLVVEIVAVEVTEEVKLLCVATDPKRTGAFETVSFQ